MRPDKPRVVVLGAGLAGLSVAHTLLNTLSCDVTIIEKENYAGGMATSLQVGGLTSDLGPHRIYSTIPEMRRWFAEFLGDSLFEVERSSRMYAWGRYLQYPPNPVELLSVVGPVEMARYAGGYLAAKARGWSSPDEVNCESFGSMMERAFGRPLCERLFFPYIRKVWKISPYEVSADVARARATMGGAGAVAKRMFGRMLGKAEAPGSETTLRKFHYVRGGIGTLANKLADEIRAKGGRIILGAEVSRLGMRDDRVVNIACTTGNPFSTQRSREQTFPADFVFSTIPITDLVGTLDSEGFVPTETLMATQRLEFLNTILVFALARKPRISQDHWLYFPEAQPPVSRAYEPKNFDESLAPADSTLLCIEGTAMPGSPEWERSDEDLAWKYIQGIVSTGILSEKEIEQTFVRRIEKAYPLYRLDYGERLERIWKSMRRISNLIPLGRQGLFLHNNMDHSIYMGQMAVRIFAEGGKPVERWYEVIPEFRNLRIVD